MKQFVIMVMALLSVTAVAWADDKDKKFSPEKFQADLEQFITKEAALTPEEAARLFPVYREMGQKVRQLFQQQQQISRSKPQGDANCREVIEQCDRLDIEMKQLQQQYHRRFMELLPPEKIYRVLRAETRFHRRALRGMGDGPEAKRGGNKRQKKD